ncbi:MAG: undecaprenyl diphosphate synthase family protein, partial [Chlamydiota bacterium]|nr:undecaprenyl diphosphate synthase family protein [Chlamydiota bacterium]
MIGKQPLKARHSRPPHPEDYPCSIPKHIAFIMDGNRRWSFREQLSLLAGYRKGCDVLIEIIQEAIKWKIEALTFYAFSTENWQRSPWEI